MIGTWMQQVAMGWLVYRLTGSAWLLGVVAFCSNAGILLFGTFSGVVADRVDRRRAIYVTQSLLALQAVTLAVVAGTGIVEPWHLVLLALWQGIANAFDIPLRQSLLVHMVKGREDLANAIALNSFLVNGARVIGPALAGLLLAITTEAVCFALNALSFVAMFWALSGIAFPVDADRRAGAGWRQSWIEGFRYVIDFAPARALLSLVAVLAWTIIPYISLMPVYAKDVYGGGPQTLGLLLASGGAGALLATLYLAGQRNVPGLLHVIVIAAAASGIALAAFAYLRYLPLAVPLIVVFGGARDPGGRIGEHDPPDDRQRPPARARRRLLHAVVPGRRAARQSRRGRDRRENRRAGDVPRERSRRAGRVTRVHAEASGAA